MAEKIEKTLSLNPSGLKDDNQRKIFLYLKVGLQAYKSRRADPPSWIVGGYGTKEVIDRALFKPAVIDPEFTAEHVAFLGKDPGEDVDGVWWEEMLVNWFEEPEEESEDEEEAEASEDAEETAKADKSADLSDTEKINNPTS